MADQQDDINFGDVEDDEEQARSQPKFEAPAVDDEKDDNYGDESGVMTMPPVGRKLSAEEKKLKKFAARIVLVEKIGNQVKGMTCAWASFVLLGAFSNNLSMRDFWFATIILLQGRIIPFSYKYVVTDWRGTSQQTSSNNSHRFWSSSCLRRGGEIAKPTKTSEDSQSRQSTKKSSNHLTLAQLRRLFSFRRCLIVTVYLMELSAAILLLYKTVAVPSEELVAKGQDPNTAIARNKKYSLVLFYCLIILESILFLVSNMYYFGKVILQGEFQKISMELGFGNVDHDLILVQSFFIDCLSSSDADRDMVTFGVDLLASDMQDKQLVGVRILSTFVRNKPNDFSRKVVINIGANLKALEALVNILDNCSSRLNDDDDDDDGDGDDDEFYTWESTATILSKLTTVEQNGFRVYQIPGSIQIICSHLLEKGKGSYWNTTRRLASEILANLAKEEDAKDVIGRIHSGGVVKKLLKIFFKKGTNSDAAGNAIVMLTFQGESNCKRILKLNYCLNSFIKAALLDSDVSPVFGLHAKKILSNLCMYSGASSDDHLVIPIIQAAPTVFKMIVDDGISSEKGKEVIVGIASYICKSKTLERCSVAEYGVEEDRLAAELVAMLIKCKDGDPIIARSVIEVATWMMTNSHVMVHTFIEKDLESILKGISDTADEEESDDFELQFLVDTALEMLKPTTSKDIEAS